MRAENTNTTSSPPWMSLGIDASKARDAELSQETNALPVQITRNTGTDPN
jgi:hypothetical protein